MSLYIDRSEFRPQLSNQELLHSINEKLFRDIHRVPYDESTFLLDRLIRWQRTGDQILRDGYTIQSKDCGDLTEAYCTLMRPYGVVTQHVKVWWKGQGRSGLHSLAEIGFPDLSTKEMAPTWYHVNISPVKFVIIEGQMPETSELVFPGFTTHLLARGQNQQEMGLCRVEDEAPFIEKHLLKIGLS